MKMPCGCNVTKWYELQFCSMHACAEETAKERDEAQEALRSLACYLGVGGYNAPNVDAKIFEQKIRHGIDELIKVERNGIEAERDEAMAMLKNLEWICGCCEEKSCPVCCGEENHAANCALAAILEDKS